MANTPDNLEYHIDVHTSVMLKKVIADAPKDYFTLEWLVGELPRHSYGFIFIILTVIALLPVISIVARLLMIVIALQIVLGYHQPMLPQVFMRRKLPSKYLAHLNRHIVPALEHLEHIVHPRWPIVLKGTRRLAAFLVLIITLLSIPAPIPLINMPPAIIGMLLALGYMEHDGLMFAAALASAIILLAFFIWVALQPLLI